MVICSSCSLPPHKIDFEDLKWGSFTKQFQSYKRQVPSSSIDNLGEFADYVLAHPDKFKTTTERRARFYQNVIEKRGGDAGEKTPAPWEIQRERERAVARERALTELLNPPTPPPRVRRVISPPPPPPVADPIYDQEGRPRTRARTRLQPRALFRGNDTPINDLRRPREDDDEQQPPPQRVARGRRIGGESKGFFGNIARAFETSWNRPATEQDKQVLRPTFQAQKILTDNILKPLAPPVGVLAEKQRQFLENKYDVGSGMIRRYM